MTGTPFCMLPVTSLNNIKIGKGKRGKIFNILLSTWSKNVGVDIEKQIKRWNSIDIKKNGKKLVSLHTILNKNHDQKTLFNC